MTTEKDKAIALLNVLIANTDTNPTHNDPGSIDDCWMDLRDSIYKMGDVVNAAAAPRDDLAKYLIRLDSAVQALHK